ncbi:Os11g0504900, partial [Oryza sativa Japonica Group]
LKPMATSVNVHGEDKVVVDMTKLVPSLPLETRCPPFPLRQYGGFWLPEGILPALEAIHTRFETRPSDVFRASFPKSGTTWLKALAFATINRDEHPPSDEHHLLCHRGPHDCVKFFEPTVAATGSLDDFAALPSPRLLCNSTSPTPSCRSTSRRTTPAAGSCMFAVIPRTCWSPGGCSAERSWTIPQLKLKVET